jgi:hypothetical protein
MTRPLAVTVAIVATLGSCLLQASTASAERVAWNLSIGGPGSAVNVGEPGYWSGRAGVHGPRHPGAWRPWHRPAFASASPWPVVYAAPLPQSVAYLPLVGYPAPFVIAPVLRVPVFVPRRVVVPAPLLLAPPQHRHARY